MVARSDPFLEGEIDDQADGAEPQRARSEIPVESGAGVGMGLRESWRRRNVVPDAREAAGADRNMLSDVNERFQLEVCYRNKRLCRLLEIPVGTNAKTSQSRQRRRTGNKGTSRRLRGSYVIDIGEQAGLR